MGTLIESLAVKRSGGGPLARSALYLADEAVVESLRRAGRRPDELDLLINTSIYHDKNIGEPAVASLIQEDVGANPGHPPVGAHGTFSFDVLNGACGVITGAHLIDGFMRSGAARLGVVVAGDVDPAGHGSSGYDFGRSGAAMLLGWDDSDAGFTGFHFQTFPEYADLFQSHVGWREAEDHWPRRRRGRNVLEVVQEPHYTDRSLDCAVSAARDFLERTETDPRTIDLVVAADSAPEFPELLGERLNLPGLPVLTAAERYRHTHTAQIIAALDAAYTTGHRRPRQKVLMLTVGAGITVALALYRPPELLAGS